MPKKKNASSLISELKRKTRRNYSSEEKIRIVIEGMCGEMTIAALCRKEGIRLNFIFIFNKCDRTTANGYKTKVELLHLLGQYFKIV